MDTTDSERAKYLKAWSDDAYALRSPGLRHLEDALAWMRPEDGATITDWGSGSGKAADAMIDKGFDVRMVDIAANAYRGNKGRVVEACLWELPDSLAATEYGFCTDVMEHIPTAHVREVLEGIAKRTRRKCYFQIALFHDTTFTHAGPLHLSVFPPAWWQEMLLSVFGTAEFRNYMDRHLMAVTGA